MVVIIIRNDLNDGKKVKIIDLCSLALVVVFLKFIGFGSSVEVRVVSSKTN